jgi:hypothetical protein
MGSYGFKKPITPGIGGKLPLAVHALTFLGSVAWSQCLAGSRGRLVSQ